MQNESFVYDEITFLSEEKMITSLLEDANRQLIKIDLGHCENNVICRNYVKFRLVHLQHHFGDYIPVKFRDVYNSLWKHLYRLEYASGYRHPYLEELFAQLMGESTKLDSNERRSTKYFFTSY